MYTYYSALTVSNEVITQFELFKVQTKQTVAKENSANAILVDDFAH